MFSSSPFSDEFEKIYLFQDSENSLESFKVNSNNLLLLKESIDGEEFATIYIDEVKKLFRVKQVDRALEVIDIENINENIDTKLGYLFEVKIIFEKGDSTYPLSQLSREFQNLKPFREIETPKVENREINSEVINSLLERVSKLEERVKQLESQNSRREKKASIGKVSDDTETVITGRSRVAVWRDRDTNLYWEVKNSKNRDESLNFEEAESYIDELNSSSYGGFSNWRIPTRQELETLFSREKSEELYIKTPLIKDVVKKYKPIYWSSTESDEKPLFVWVAYFHHGYGDYKYKSHSYYLKAVRG